MDVLPHQLIQLVNMTTHNASCNVPSSSMTKTLIVKGCTVNWIQLGLQSGLVLPPSMSSYTADISKGFVDPTQQVSCASHLYVAWKLYVLERVACMYPLIQTE